LLPLFRGLDKVEGGEYGLELFLIIREKEFRSSRGVGTGFSMLC
jgi:hypothetical protein